MKIFLDTHIKSLYIIILTNKSLFNFNKVCVMGRTLTLEQMAAIRAKENNVLVSAAAGSGKTTVITERMKYLLVDKKVNPKSIVCITFTRNAAEELKTRLSEMGIKDAGFIGTIHAFAYFLLGKGESEENKFEIYSDYYDDKFHRELIESYAKYITYSRWKKYKKLEEQYNKGEISSEILEGYLSIDEIDELNAINGDYKYEWNHPTIVDLCLKNNVITFDEMLKRAINYFKENNIELSHMLVDEFQDVGNLEYGFIKALNSKNYYFCGDDYQSIYGFKGADPTIFLSCSKSKKFKTYKLTKNFRCDSNILTLSNEIIDNIPYNLKMTKNVVGNSKEIGKVSMCDYTDDKILNIIKNMSKEQLKNCFVLTRSNEDLNEIKMKLHNKGIDTITFRQAMLTNEEISQAMNADELKLLTIHSSKGLEADNVILVGNFNVKPSDWAIRKYYEAVKNGETLKFNIWEEQRIFYVGATRAKHNLYVLGKTHHKTGAYRVTDTQAMLRKAEERKYKYAYNKSKA